MGVYGSVGPYGYGGGTYGYSDIAPAPVPVVPAFRIRLRQYTPDGVRGRVIPTMTLAPDLVYGDAATCRATVSAKAYASLPEFPILAALEFSTGSTWVEPANARFLFQGDDEDAVDPTGTRTLTGVQFTPWMLQRALMQYSGGPADSNGQRMWGPGGMTPGGIVNGMMLEAHNRGWGSFVTSDSSYPDDSSGTAWAESSLQITYNLGVSLWSVLKGLSDQGVAEFTTTGNVLHLWNPGHGTDWSTGDTIVRLSHEARSVPIKRDWSTVLTDVTLAGDDNLIQQVNNPGAPTTFGRLEGWVNASGSSDAATLTALGQSTLDQASTPSREIQVQADAHQMPNLPWVSYDLGDWVQVHADQGWEKGRVVELVVNQDTDGSVSITTIIGDRNQSLLSKLANKAGATAGSGNAQPVVPTPNPPDKPQHLAGTAVGYWDTSHVAHSRVSLTWDAVTADSNGLPVPVNTYEVQVTVDSSSRSVSVGTNSAVIDGLPVDTTGSFAVRALSSTGVWGPLSDSISIPLPSPTGKLPTPPAPVLVASPQGMLAHWDGTLGGEAPPGQFDHLYALTSTTSGGSYTPAGGTLSGAGDILLPKSGAVWVRFAAVDTMGVESDWGPAVQVSAEPSKPDTPTVTSNTGEWDQSGTAVGVVVLSWAAVTTDITGATAAVDQYKVWRTDISPAYAVTTVTTATVTLTLPVDTPETFQVRAHASTGVWGLLSDPVTVTPDRPTDTLGQPSDPVVTTAHSAVSVAWDGVLASAPPPPQFWQVLVQRTADSGGSPDPGWGPVGALSTAGAVTVSSVHMGDVLWLRLVPVDHLGVTGTPSTPVKVTVVGTAADDIVAGSITVNELSPTVGSTINIDGNVTITSVKAQVAGVQSGLDSTNATVQTMQTTFSVLPDGAYVSSPGGSGSVRIGSTPPSTSVDPTASARSGPEIDMLINGQVAAYLNSGQMYVHQLLAESLVLGNHRVEKYGASGTVVRKV